MPLSFFWENPEGAEIGLDHFVNSGVPEEVEKRLDRKKWPSILGDDHFIQVIRDRFIQKEAVYEDQPQGRELNRWNHPTAAEVIDTICDKEKISRQLLFKRTCRENKDVRALTIFLLDRLVFMSY